MTPPTHTPAHPLFTTLAESLRNELDALTSSPRNVVLFAGMRVGSFAGMFYYRFEIPEHLVLRSVNRLECSLGTTQPLQFSADLIAIENQFLTIAIPYDCGTIIPELACSWEYSPTLKPIIDTLGSLTGQVADMLLNPDAANNLHGVAFEPSMLPDTPPDQQSALKKILQNRVSYVWGPILSGKTHLLAHVASNYIKAGKTVLFVATMNERVDDVLLRSIDIGQKLGIDMSIATCCLGLPAIENFEKLGRISFDQHIAVMRAEKKKSFQERVTLLETYWKSRIRQILHEDYTARLNEMRDRLSERKKQIEQLSSEILPLKDAVHRIQNSSMMDKLKKGFGKDDLALAQKRLDDKASALKRLQSTMTSLTQESLRIEAHAPLSGEELQKFRQVSKRIDELGGLEKVDDAVHQYTAVNELALLESKHFVGTTLVNALSDPRLVGRQFDMVMVDDAEGIPLPFLAALASRSKEKMLVCGDPYQLGPDSVAKSGLAQEWLQHDIFLHVARTDHLTALFDFTEQHAQWCSLLSSHFASTPKLSLFIGSILFDDKINVFASPNARGRIFFIDTTSLHSQAKQYLGRKKILPHNELQGRKVLELVKHAMMEPGRKATDIGVVVPFPGPSLSLKALLRTNGIRTVEVGMPHSFKGRRKKAIILDTVAAGLDHTIRQIDDQKIGEYQIVRLLNTVLSCVEEDLYVLADLSHFQALYKDRLLTKLLVLLMAQSDPLVNFSLPAKDFDELDWDKRNQRLSFSGEAPAIVPPTQNQSLLKNDAEFAVQMKMMAKKEGQKVEAGKNFERETFQAVQRVLGMLDDINLLSQFSGGDILFRHSLSTETASAKLPFTVCLSEKEFRQAMEDWNLVVFEMSGGHTLDSAFFKNAPETKVRWDINALKIFYSTSVDSVVEEGKQKLAVAVARIFQECVGKSQPANPQEWATGYLNFLGKLEAYLGWISEQLRK